MDLAQQAALCNPAFASYGVPYGYRMTEWLYADRQSNPFAGEPAKWSSVGRVAFLDRTITFTAVPAVGGVNTQIQQVNLGGGKNIIIFARMATAVVATAPVAGAAFPVLPNEESSYVTLQIQRQSGFIDVETAPIQNNFGFGWRPNIRPVPELWLGNESRQFTLTNLTNNVINVSITFTCALLDTGR